jgi:hypothetical protein
LSGLGGGWTESRMGQLFVKVGSAAWAWWLRGGRRPRDAKVSGRVLNGVMGCMQKHRVRVDETNKIKAVSSAESGTRETVPLISLFRAIRLTWRLSVLKASWRNGQVVCAGWWWQHLSEACRGTWLPFSSVDGRRLKVRATVRAAVPAALLLACATTPLIEMSGILNRLDWGWGGAVG